MVAMMVYDGLPEIKKAPKDKYLWTLCNSELYATLTNMALIRLL